MKKQSKLISRILLFSLSLLISNSQYAQHLSIDNGNLVNTGSLVLSGNLSLNVDGNLNSKGGSHFYFQGNTIQKINGSGSMGFSDLTINNSSMGVILTRNISIYGDLTMLDGNLDLLNHNLLLGQNGDVMGENASSMIMSTSGNGSYTANTNAGNGSVTRTIDISTLGVSNAAGLGITITPSSNWGSCLITRSHQRVVGFDGDNSIFRKITITPTNNEDLASSISFKYDNGELNGNNAGNLKIFQLKKKGAKGDEWQELPSSDNGSEVSATSIDVDENELIITLASTASTLPISLLDFTSKCDNGLIDLKWQTASETNNDYFLIEKSIDGIYYNELAKIDGNGTTSSINSYEFTDLNESDQTLYHRLTQFDYDGKQTVFNPIKTSCGSSHELEYTIVNPVHNQIQFWSSEPLNIKVKFALYDITGKIVLRKELYVNQSAWSFSVGNLSTGLYHMQLLSSNQHISKTISITK